jgi:glycosyltransferase involved in cell wall biosynthesis
MANTARHTPVLMHVFSNFVASGPELRTVALMNAFGDRYRHLVVSMDGRTSALERVNSGVDVRLLPAPSSGGTLRIAAGLRSAIRREKPDVLLTYNWGAYDALLAGAVGRVPIIHHEDGFNADEASRLKRRRIWARRLVFGRTRSLIVPSHTLARIAAERWGVRPPKLRLIPNGIDAARLAAGASRGHVRARLGIPEHAIVLGTIAHLRREKRLDRIVSTLAAFPTERRPHAIIVGEGAERAALERTVRELQVTDALHLVGDQKNVGEYLRACDIYALTSDTEQMPISLLEAMCCRLPVVATRVGDVEQMLPGPQREWTVPLGDEEQIVSSLAAACDRMARDHRVRTELGALNRGHASSEFSFERMMQQYAHAYDEALSQSPRSAQPAFEMQ